MIWLYRRPLLDYWCEGEDTLGAVVTHVLVHEIGHHFGLSDDDMAAIEASAGRTAPRARPSQGRHLGYRLWRRSDLRRLGETRGENGASFDGSCSSGVAGDVSGAGAERGLPALELLSAIDLVLAGRDQGGVSRPRQHRLGIRHAVRSPTFEMRLPSVVSLKSYVKPSRFPAFTRFNVFLRDRFTCQYCGEREDLTFDHVVPRSKGGVTTWENVVAACSACNLQEGRFAAVGRAHVAGAPALPADGARPASERPAVPAQLPPREWMDYLYWDSELEP